MRGIISFLNINLFVVGFILIAGCDHTFEPLQENDQYYFSMYGYLDAAADTQWVRISPTRENINEIPDTTGTTVTLENIESGEKIVMNDSLFGSDNFLNYWATTDVENEQSYKITAERADGKSSTVILETPKEVPSPIVIDAEDFFDIYIDDSIETVADVQVKWYIIVEPHGIRQRRTYTFPLRNRIEHSEAFGGSFTVSFNADQQLQQIQKNNGGNMAVAHRQFFVASGGPEWDDSITSIDDLEYFLDETTSNVEDGLGYVIGIDSKWVPLKACLTPEKTTFIPCDEEEPFW